MGVSVVIVEDRWMVADAYRAVLDSEPDIAALAVHDGPPALEACAEATPDVILIDADPLEGHGLPLIAGLRAIDPSVRIVMLSEIPDPALEEQFSDAGVAAFRAKREVSLDLVGFVRRIAGC